MYEDGYGMTEEEADTLLEIINSKCEKTDEIKNLLNRLYRVKQKFIDAKIVKEQKQKDETVLKKIDNTIGLIKDCWKRK